MVSDQFFKMKRSGVSIRCTAVLFGAVFVMAVHAPDCKKDLDVYETFILNGHKISRERRRAGAKDFFITDDLDVELGLCTDEDNIGEPYEMQGPLLAGKENDHGGFKKLMRSGIMKEFNSKGPSTWSNCGREEKVAVTPQQFGGKGKEIIAQLDYIIGPKRKSDAAYMYNDVKIWDSWDHYPIDAVTQENEAKNYFPEKRRKNWAGWRPKTMKQQLEFQNAVIKEKRREARRKLGNYTGGYQRGCGQNGAQHDERQRQSRETHAEECEKT